MRWKHWEENLVNHHEFNIVCLSDFINLIVSLLLLLRALGDLWIKLFLGTLHPTMHMQVQQPKKRHTYGRVDV